MALDYKKLYFLEDYLFTEVAARFAETGTIDPTDFYMIIIWKSNRAKTRVRDRLIKKAGSFAQAVKKISASLYDSDSPMRRLEILMKEWGFRLPMATAILTVLYPTDFTVYDTRVCEQLGKFDELSDRQFSDDLWNKYQKFLKSVYATVPGELSLRDKDRYLWGRSFYEGVRKDLQV